MSRRRTGADSLTRTDDLPLTRRLLYQLSYAGPKADYTCPPHALPRDAGDALRERRAGVRRRAAFRPSRGRLVDVTEIQVAAIAAVAVVSLLDLTDPVGRHRGCIFGLK